LMADDQLQIRESPCDSYCFNVLKPMLEHIAVMQDRWQECGAIKLSNASARLDAIEGQLRAQQVNEANNAAAIEETKQKLSKQDKLIEKYKNGTRKPFEKIGSGYYYIEDMQRLNWYGAAHKCRLHGGNLISPNNKQELSEVRQKLNANHVYWTDINDLSKENEFLSLTTGRSAEFLNWGSGEPNNARQLEHCVTLGGSSCEMNDIPCNSETYFICESVD
ncbi:hypothetical protein KR044_002228, partial [Drosophila immigrans]